MARVKCIMMQRDEELLLEPWLRYYGYLFGFENLCVFDHGSVRPDVIETLRFYERLGVETRWDLTSPGDFLSKGQHFRNVIRHWDQAGDYDFVFPVDCDEFLALFTESGITCGRQAIHAALDALPPGQGVFKFDLSLFNVPEQPGWFAVEPFQKTFARCGAIGDIDHSFQSIQGRDGTEEAGHTSFVYLHHHYKTLARTREQASQKLEGLVDTGDLDALRAYDGPARHLVRHFLLDEAQYRSQFDGHMLLEIPQFQLLLAGLGVEAEALVGTRRQTPATGAPAPIVVRPPKQRGRRSRKPVVFDVERYGALNPDVAPSGNFALKHYLVFGHKEGRAL